MRPIDYIIFDISGWDLLEVKKLEKRWMNKATNDLLSINLFEARPDFKADLSELDILHEQTLDSVRQFSGEIAEIRRDVLDEVPGFRVIIKIPQAEGGYTYIGSYTLPFQESSYVMKVQARETKQIGQREAFALQQLIHSGAIDLDLNSPTFSPDSITPEMEALISRTSDSVDLDQQFPQHPLSRTRHALNRIHQTIELNAELKKLEPFQYK